MTSNPDRAESIFSAAVALSAGERAAYLDQACAGDADLRGHVEALLHAHEGAGHLLDQPVPGGPRRTGPYVPNEQPGTVVAGRYKLLEEIGEGGMGTVWVAEQTQPVRRKVALKLIKAGMDSKSVLSRFEAERQALAMMDHPNIAKVLDGGTTESGRPFFVMEYVKGIALTKYCDDTRLSIAERLALFVPVCLAVQHAHQKGIIHRDLKPSNILICLYDGKPVPKVIDFGLAKAIHQPLTEHTLHTAHNMMLGTPLYMSPEQAEFNNLDVDTRTDIYALGVILYELLTGTTPLEKQRFTKAAWQEMLRLIKEEEPQRPSARLSGSGSLPNLAAQRQLEPTQLTRLMRGELDWIAMKCLEKQRDRRYETATGLARDLQRYLANEVVEARPASAGYRLRKFVSRHRGPVAAAALVLLVLLAGIAGTSWGLLRAARANAELEAKNAELADERAKVQARFELAQKAIATFHTGVSEDMLLKNEQFKELRTRLLREAAAFYADLEKILLGQTDAKSRQLLASGYYQFGELMEKIGSQTEALAVHRKALAVRSELAAEGAGVEARLDVARSWQAVGNLRLATGDTAGALAAYQEQRDIAAALAAESPTDAVQAMLASGDHNIGRALWAMGKPTEGLTAFRQALAIRQKLTEANPGATDFQSDLARSHHAIGSHLSQTGKPTEGLTAYRQALAIREKLAEANPAVTQFQSDLALSHSSISVLLYQEGRWSEALPAREASLAIQRKLAEANPAVTQFQSDLARSHLFHGVLLEGAEKPDEALEAYRQALAIRQKLTKENPNVTLFQEELAVSHVVVAEWLTDSGKPAEALEAYRQALAIRQKLTGANPFDQAGLAQIHYGIGRVLSLIGKPGEALAANRHALAIMQKVTETNPTVTELLKYLSWSHSSVGAVLEQMGKPAEALAAYRQALDINQRLADDHPNLPFNQEYLADSLNAIGRIYARQRQFAEGFAALDKGLALRQKLADAHPTIPLHDCSLGGSYADRGGAHVRAGHPAEAAADLRRAIVLWDEHQVILQSPGSDSRFERARVLALLAGLAADARSGVTMAEAARFADQAVAALRKAVGAGWANWDELKEPEFDALRQRGDFRMLMHKPEK